MKNDIIGIKRGDYARMTVEGEVTGVGGDWIELDNVYYDTDDSAVKSVDKIESPVTVFTTGDTVKGNDGWANDKYLIVDSGYVSLDSYTFYPRDMNWLEAEFTSERYTKVN